jgi:repressor LexA
MPVTPRQREIYEYLRGFVEVHEYAPTIAEICSHFGLKSTGTIHQTLSVLDREGLIHRTPNISRGIEIVEKKPAEPEDEIPLLGVVAAGLPIEAILSHEIVCVPRDMLGGNRTFALRVRGDSMIDEHIRDGDCIIVQSRPTAENGQTVVALVDGSDATVKRFYRESNHVRLEPANVNYKPIVIRPPGRVSVQGVVVGVIRKYKA